MPLPQQVRNIPDARKATAPYNFVPLPEKVVTLSLDNLPDHDRYDLNRHTGYFDVELTTRSALYVRCALPRELFDRDQKKQDCNGDPVNDQTPYVSRIKNKPDFFYTEQSLEPVIPGSSLRGMLRALLEIVSFGKFERVAEKKLIYRAVGDPTALGAWYRQQVLGSNRTTPPNMQFDYPSPLLKGGYLFRQGGRYYIRPAQSHCGESLVHVEYSAASYITGGNHGNQNFHHVYVQPAGRVSSMRGPRGGGNLELNLALTSAIRRRTPHTICPTGWVPGILIESGHMGGAHQKHMHCVIYEPDHTVNLIPISEEQWIAYEEDRDITRGLPTRGLQNNDDPLFYLIDSAGNLVFFGSTLMFRLVYQHSIHDRVPSSLRNPLLLDFADALFGYIRQKKQFSNNQLPEQGDKRRAYAGRVLVTDAVLIANQNRNNLWLGDGQPITPPILSTPKPTSFQHYLVQPPSNGNQPSYTRENLSHYDSPCNDQNNALRGHQTVVRGHKLYWNKGRITAQLLRQQTISQNQNQPPASNSKQHTTFKPVNENIKFKFRVYFENLSDVELGALCWILRPAGENNKTYCHKLGMGKSFGMGAVLLQPTLYLTGRQSRYSGLFNDNDWQTGLINVQGESLSDQGTHRNRIKDFEEFIACNLGHTYNNNYRLYRDERIKRLLHMMEWPGVTAPTSIELMGVDRFRHRPVLPDPMDIATRADPPPAQQQSFIPPPPSDLKFADVQARIRKFQGANTPESGLQSLANEIGDLPDGTEKCQCARHYRKWIRDNKKLRARYESSDWFKILQAICDGYPQ